MLNFPTLSCCLLPQTLRFLLETWKYPSNIWLREISVILLNNRTQAYSSRETVLNMESWLLLQVFTERWLSQVLHWGTCSGPSFILGRERICETLSCSISKSQRIFFSSLELYSLSTSNTNNKLSSVWFLFDLIILFAPKLFVFKWLSNNTGT